MTKLLSTLLLTSLFALANDFHIEAKDTLICKGKTISDYTVTEKNPRNAESYNLIKDNSSNTYYFSWDCTINSN